MNNIQLSSPETDRKVLFGAWVLLCLACYGLAG